MKLDDFFACQNVLVCGASGMSGRNLFKKLGDSGAWVLGTQYGKKIDGLATVNFENFSDALNATKNQRYVFICCAKTYNAKMCEENPQSMILPNIQMVSNILEASLRNGVKKVLYMSSATVYQPSFKELSEEDMDWNQNPANLYMGVGWVKRYIEKLCEFYVTRGLNVVTVRPTNIYGPYDKNDEKVQHVVPAFIQRALLKEDPFIVYGNGNAIKDFIYVEDAVRDMMRVMAYHRTPDPINICSGDRVSIKELARIVLEEVGSRSRIVCTSDDADKIPIKAVSRAKLDSLYGKETYTPLTYGIEKTVEWFSSLPQTAKV